MLSENVQYILMFIGALTCLMFAIFFLCASGLIAFLVWDGYTARRKTMFAAKHQGSGKLYAVPGFEDGWIAKAEMSLTNEKKEEFKRKFTGGGTYNPSPEVLAEREKRQSEEAVAVLKEKLAARTPSRHAASTDETTVYPVEIFPSKSFDERVEYADRP